MLAFKFSLCQPQQLYRSNFSCQVGSRSNGEHDRFHPEVWSSITNHKKLWLSEPPQRQQGFQEASAVNEHLMAVVTKSPLWLLSSSDSWGWHFNLKYAVITPLPWRSRHSQCGGWHPEASRGPQGGKTFLLNRCSPAIGEKNPKILGWDLFQFPSYLYSNWNCLMTNTVLNPSWTLYHFSFSLPSIYSLINNLFK